MEDVLFWDLLPRPFCPQTQELTRKNQKTLLMEALLRLCEMK